MTQVPSVAVEREDEPRPLEEIADYMSDADTAEPPRGDLPTDEFAIAAGEAPANPWQSHPDHHEEEAFHVKKKAFTKDELDMTSLVDVTFLLLVFFMITASFTVTKSLQIAPPESDDSASSSQSAPVMTIDDVEGESIIVEVDEQDHIKVDDKAVAGMAELKNLLKDKLTSEKKTDVLIEAAYKATHGQVVAVTDAAIEVGMQKVRRASRRED
jgi:biopolymer transport protein ExbD